MEIVVLLVSVVILIGLFVGLSRLTCNYEVKWSNGSDSTFISANSPILAYEKFLEENSSDESLEVIVCHRFSKTNYRYDNHLENHCSQNITTTSIKPFPCIGIADRALIAKEAISYFPYDEYEAVVDLLQGQGEKRKAIEELNLKIRVNYENFLFEAIGEEFSHSSFKEQVDEEIEKIMQLGIRGILKKYETGIKEESVEEISREIKSSESWDEIKNRL